jgi:DNA-binding transcriptional MerR regulator
MRIGELSSRSGVSASRIRFYERHKLIPEAARGENGYRDYPASAVKRLDLIDGAQQLGFTLSEIREGLDEAAPAFPAPAAIAKALRGKLEAVDRHIKEAQARRRRIVHLLKELGC